MTASLTRVRRWLENGWLIPILLLSFALRVGRLGDRSVWWDEGASVWAARQSLTALTQWTAHDVHPPLYYWLLHFWRLASGDSEWGLRLLSALFGTMMVAAAFLLGRRAGGTLVGLLSALFLTVARFAIDWSQEMRMYTLTATLATLAWWATLRLWQHLQQDRPLWTSATRWDVFAYSLFMVAGLYTLYLSVLVLVVTNLVWLFWILPLSAHRARMFWRWSVVQLLVIVLYLPWLLYILSRLPTWSISATSMLLTDFLQIYGTVLTIGIPLNVSLYARWTVPVFVVFFLGLFVLIVQGVRLWRQQNPRQLSAVWLLLVGLFFPALVVYVGSLPRNFFFYAPPMAPRYLLIFLPAYVILLAWGIRQLSHLWTPKPWLAPLQMGLLTALVLWVSAVGMRGYYATRVRSDDFASLAATIQAYQQAEDEVILHNDVDWPIFAYHYPDHWRGVPNSWQMTPESAETFLAPIWQTHEGVWLVLVPYAMENDPQGELAQWLADRAQVVVEYPYEDRTLRFYARTPERAAEINQIREETRPRFPLTLSLPQAQITGFDLFAQDFHSGDTIHLFLYGQGQQAVIAQIGLIDDAGKIWQMQEVTLLEANEDSPEVRIRQQVDLLVAPDIPSGHYQFQLLTAEATPFTFGSVMIRQEGDAVLTLADVTIAVPLAVRFGEKIQLLGYDVNTERVETERVVDLTLYWQTAEAITEQQKVFTHLIGTVYNAEWDNFLWGQQDNEPVSNTRPTTTWRSNEVIVDHYAIPLQPQTPAGAYQVEIGLYDPITGVRLWVTEGSEPLDHLILTTIILETE